MDEKYIKDQIITVLEKIRPFLNRDGGDIEFVDYKDGEVFVRMIGACAGCDLIDSTLQDGVATLLKEEVPGVVKVTNVVD
jgi:Fe-S cluster biogenesis protein NfuA